jgi:hypothetical protein
MCCTCSYLISTESWRMIFPISLSELKVDVFNSFYDFTLFEFLKDVLILTFYIQLNILILNQFHLKLR